jgi:hypothetical protein
MRETDVMAFWRPTDQRADDNRLGLINLGSAINRA